MIRGYTIGVVIPCYNEEQGLQAIFSRIPREVDEVIVVDNNSTDRTAEVARAHGARVVFEVSPGYGSAYQAGFSAARSDLLVTMDGDGQYPVEDVPRLVELLLDRQLDCLSGTRFPLDGSTMPLLRRVGNVLLTLAARILFGARLRDTQSGMWVFRRDLFNVIRPLHPSMPFSEEFKLRTVVAGLRFAEEHIHYAARLGESTLRPFHHGWENLKFLVTLRREIGTARHPRVSAARLPQLTPQRVRERG